MKVPDVNTDTINVNVFNYLLSDLGRFVDLEDACSLRHEDLENVRANQLVLHKYSDPYTFKVKMQINNYFKRYVFGHELTNVEQLREATHAKFVETQMRVGSLVLSHRESTRRVIQLARIHIKRILGKYDHEQHLQCCEFGKRAAVGLPYTESYLDIRVSKTITGSSQHLEWFKTKVIPKDDLLRRIVKDTPYAQTTCLRLSDVDKTWDKRRTILANTIIGGFYTAGLGNYMSDCLKADGYNLNRRAEKHRVWVKGYSRSLSHVTADLSAASDSFSSALMNALFPRSWYSAMKMGMIRTFGTLGKSSYLASFMTMGMGFTFPAQTIAFLCLLRAIQDLTRSHGRVSVFGDDLIYPIKMHNVVSSVFEDLGFILNKEKTFVTTPFRESCGSDFYDGVNVRPFQQEGAFEILRGLNGLSFLYRLYNGLRLRWTEEEIPSVYRYLLSEISTRTKCVHYVPSDYPVFSGIQTEHRLLGNKSNVTYDANGSFVCCHIAPSYRLRKVPDQLVYLWDNLRKLESGREPSMFDKLEDTTVLKWVKDRVRKSRPGKPPIWLVKLVPHVPLKGAPPRFRERC